MWLKHDGIGLMNKTFCTGILIPGGCGSNGNMNCELHDEPVACATLEGRTEILTNVFFSISSYLSIESLDVLPWFVKIKLVVIPTG